MSATPGQPNPGRIRDYLLRRLPDADRTRFEEAYFNDDSLLDRVEAEEDLLVSDYVLGKLTESDRRRFEESLLGTPYYKDRVETTSRLQKHLARHASFRHGFGRAGLSTRSTRPGAPSSHPDEAGLFPGRTGLAVAFGLLAVLLVASLVSAVRLKSELEIAMKRSAAPPPSAAAPSAGGFVPATQTVVFGSGPLAGPYVRRLGRPAGAPLLLVFSRGLLAPSARAFSVTLVDEQGHSAWESGAEPLGPGREEGDLALRLPPGVPPAGRFGVLLAAEPRIPGPPALGGVLEIHDVGTR